MLKPEQKRNDSTPPSELPARVDAKPSRRTVLGVGALAGAALGTALLAPPAWSAPAPRRAAAGPAAPIGSTFPEFTSSRWVNQPFAYSHVSIDGGVYTRGQTQGLRLARNYPIDRILAVFRRNAGLDTRGATPPGGWEEYGPDPQDQRWGPAEYSPGKNKAGAGGLLRGHYAGHFLSMLSLAYANTGEAALKSKVSKLVSGLKECRDALAVQKHEGKPRYSHPGFLSAYGEWQFSALEDYAPYGEIWAPYYTLHKILDGLNHAHSLTGDETALELAEGIGRWVYSRLSKCTDEQLQKMWGIYIGGEYGGMNDALVELYSASTASDREVFLKAARLFDMTALIEACAEGRDTLTDKHANQHIPQFVGYAKLYAVTQEVRYLNAVRGFFDMVVPGRMYAHGGTGEGELWGPAHTVAGDIGERNAESCAAYNMVKVAWQLFHLTGEHKYMDYCERTVLNHLLGGHRDEESSTSPENCYMFPVHAGARKEYGDGNIGTCCGGTGLESPMRYQETAYAHTTDGSTLMVNLYLSSTLSWPERGVTLRETTQYPRDGAVRFRFATTPKAPLTLALRVPEWVQGEATATVNGSGRHRTAEGGTYLKIHRAWQRGDTVEFNIPIRAWAEPTPDREDLQALRFGPMVLALSGEAEAYPKVSLSPLLNLSGGLEHAVVWSKDTATMDGRKLDPLYAGHDIAYSTYFQRTEPTVAFGGLSTGIANPEGEEGKTFLGEIWEQAPFADRNDFLSTVNKVSKNYVKSGALGPEDRQKILVVAAQARMEA